MVNGEIGLDIYYAYRFNILDHAHGFVRHARNILRNAARNDLRDRGGKINAGFLLECVHLARRNKEAMKEGLLCRRNTEITRKYSSKSRFVTKLQSAKS